MENASKALIIAGAILLSILIIGLGMGIYQQATSAVEGAGLDAQKIKTYNSEFDPYIKNGLKGTEVRALCDIVKSHNLAEEDQTTDNIRIVSLDGAFKDADSSKGGIKAENIDKLKRTVKPGNRYDLEATYNGEGLISCIKISDHTTKKP